MNITARDVWGQGPEDILVVAESAIVLGPVDSQNGRWKEGSGIATVHIDLSKEEALKLIVQLQDAVDSVNAIEATLNEEGNWGPLADE